MAATEKSEYVCTLSDELIKKAEEELNEKAQWRSRDIQALRDMLEKRPGEGWGGGGEHQIHCIQA